MKNNTIIFTFSRTVIFLALVNPCCALPPSSSDPTVGSGIMIIPPKGVSVEIQNPPAPQTPTALSQTALATTSLPQQSAVAGVQLVTPMAKPTQQTETPAAPLAIPEHSVTTSGRALPTITAKPSTTTLQSFVSPVVQTSVPSAPLAHPSGTAKTEFQKLLEESQAQKSKTQEKETKRKQPIKPIRTKGNLIDFSFDQAPLIDVIKRYADKKKLNIILPQPTTSMRQTITFKPYKLLTLKEAEKYLYLFLDYVGYAVSPEPEFAIVIKNKNLSKNALPLYVLDATSTLKVEDLPNSDTPVRAVYYFSNLKVTDTPNNSVVTLLQDMLSGTGPEYILTDSQSNGVIITDKSRIVRQALQILRELDSVSSLYVLTTLQLYNASAVSVADLLKSQILAVQPVGFGGEKPPAGAGSYFSSNIKVVADDRRNTLIIWGKEAAVNRLKEFVREYMDAPLESGKSVFHVYDLKYLDAELFAPVLDQVVKGQGIGAGEQAIVAPTTGARRFFEGVIVRAETYKPVESPQQPTGQGGGDFDQVTTATSTGTVYRGGNRILVAAQPTDWEQIKNLIDQLDIPQRQVILEVLICDYTRDETKLLRSQVRNLERMDFRPGVGFQTANLNGVFNTEPNYGISANSTTNPQNIVGDLLRIISGHHSMISGSHTDVDPGSLIISLNDPAGTGIWSIFNILNSIGTAKILTHPYLVALNNTNASIQNTEVRRSEGDASSTTGGAVTINIQDYSATVSVSMTPKISSANRLTLEVVVQIQEFNKATGFQRMSRALQTNVNMASPNQVLLLGGLTRFIKGVDAVETPILSRIPIIQWFFRGMEIVTEDTELGIFIRPTIVEPKLRDEMNAYTRSKIHSGSKTADMYPLGNQKDPIVRFFFGKVPPEEAVIESYMQKVNIVAAPEISKPESPAQLQPAKAAPET